MKYVLIITGITFIIFFQTVFGQTFYVSPSGNDANPGTMEAPLYSLQGSLTTVKNSGGSGTVYFREGTYVFDKTAVINNDNCKGNITFAAYQGENVQFTSGIPVSGWSLIGSDDSVYFYLPEAARKEVYVADVPAGLGTIRYLSDKNSDWLEPGKINVTEFVTTEKYIHGQSVEGQMWDPPEEKKVCTFSKSLDNLSNVDSALTFTIYTADFELQILPVEQITGNRLVTATPGGHRLALPDEGQKHGSSELAFIHNLAEGIDAPGKFACYPEEGKIYLWPKNGTGEIFAPALNELIRVEGLSEGREAWLSTSPEVPVSDIVFDGITLTQGKQPVWEEDDLAAQHDWAMLDKDNALLRFRGVENCVVKNCIFEKSGGAGLAFDLYAKNNIVENNTFRFLGYEAIRLAGYGIGLKDENKYNTIRQNEIHHVNQIHHYGAAIVLWNTGFNQITDNYFHHFASRAILFSAPRSRAFTKNNQTLFPSDRRMREQAWPMARWFEIPDSVLATIYYAQEEEDGETLDIRRVEVNGYKQGSPGGLIADRFCSYYRHLRGNVVENNVIGYGAEALYADGIFYITACASGEPNKIRNNYIYNTGKDLPQANIPFRLIYIDGYTGRFEFTENFAYNCKFRFEVTAMYNWWDEVDNFANLFYQVDGEEYGDRNICIRQGPNNPLNKYIDNYKQMLSLLGSYNWNYPGQLPGSSLMVETLQSVISELE
jgi:hypothetical protein